jgi:hypothetical protein
VPAAALAVPAEAAALLVEGNPESRIRPVVDEDLQGPACAAFGRMMDEQLLPRLGSNGVCVHPDAKHAWARPAAIAGRRFAGVSSEMGGRRRPWIPANLRPVTAENFCEKPAGFARRQGADPEAAVRALDNAEYAALVERDLQRGVARGLKTPAGFVNGRPFIERLSFEEIAGAIEAALR